MKRGGRKPDGRYSYVEKMSSMVPPAMSRSREHGRAAVLGAWAAIITAASGGVAGIVSAITGAKKHDVDAVEQRIVDRVEDKIDREVQRNHQYFRNADDYQNSLLCQLNEGAPHESFRCDGVNDWFGPPLGHTTPKFRTGKPYPSN